MSNISSKCLPIVFLCLSLAGCTSESGLTPFVGEGCSLLPDASLINEQDWCECCVEHNIAYWQGGTEQKRERVDTALMRCVYLKTNNHEFPHALFEGARFGGSPYFHDWYRWGYGWPKERMFQALTDDEKNQAMDLLADYRASKQSVCKTSL
tara:strand:+ start:463 stop:918 length:456 start_codon:yes stop_codon:yes gene_type:complete